jgi:hypothetical protein
MEMSFQRYPIDQETDIDSLTLSRASSWRVVPRPIVKSLQRHY